MTRSACTGVIILTKQTSRELDAMTIVVGDISADNYIGPMVAKLLKLKPDLEIFGVGGPQMEKNGVKLLTNCSDLSVIGIFETIALFPRLAKLRSQILQQISEKRPKLVLLVDFSGFNLILAKSIKAKFKDLPIYYFISPQIWGSRPWRIHSIKQAIDKMFVIFPFEVDIYKSHNIPVKFVGHPLLTKIQFSQYSKEKFCQKYNLQTDQPIIAVFPGSRKLEIANITPVFFDAICELAKTKPQMQFIISKANEFLAQKISDLLAKNKNYALLKDKITFIDSSDNYELFNACDLVWAKSGTTTLEATIFKKPLIVVYRGSYLSYFFYLIFRQTKLVSLPNILYRDYMTPELMQKRFTVKNLISDTNDILNVPEIRLNMIQMLESLTEKLGQGNYIDNLTAEILALFETKSLVG